MTDSEKPLIITSYLGRDKRCPALLVKLADLVPGLRVHDTGGSDMSFPASHPSYQGFSLASDECSKHADLILLLDCDVPWIPSKNAPPKGARIYHIDIDPLNQQIPTSFFPAHGRWRADTFTALQQLVSQLSAPSFTKILDQPKFTKRKIALVEEQQRRLEAITSQCHSEVEQPLDASNIGRLLKDYLPKTTVFVVEAVTCAKLLADQIQPDAPGTWINCGATGIGWSNGAALGVKMALDDDMSRTGSSAAPSLVCQIVGDGSLMCAAPSSAFWVASKYKIPILTIVLNNGGM